MNELLQKLKLKTGTAILLLNLPPAFHAWKEALRKEGFPVKEQDGIGQIDFLLAFVTQKEQIEDIANQKTPLLEGDAPCWLAYPKKSSKSYKSDLDRDHGWEAMGLKGWEPVSQIAIDEDWSALRFRKVEFIKTLTRRKSMALSAEAKKRTSGN